MSSIEDPTWNFEGLSQVRQSVEIPLATNMCLVAYEQLAPGSRLRSIDVILADVHFWGGFSENQWMVAECDAFQLGVGLRSDRELDIYTAAMLHLAASTPSMRIYAINSPSSTIKVLRAERARLRRGGELGQDRKISQPRQERGATQRILRPEPSPLGASITNFLIKSARRAASDLQRRGVSFFMSSPR